MNYKKQTENIIDKFQKADNLTKCIYLGVGVLLLIVLKWIVTAMIPVLIIGGIVFLLFKRNAKDIVPNSKPKDLKKIKKKKK